MPTPAASLAQLLEVAKSDLTGQFAAEALADALDAALELKAASGWADLEGEEVSAVALTRALGDILKDNDTALQGRAASVYAALLTIKDAPVGTLCEPYAFSTFVHCLRGICLPSKREGAGDVGTQQGDAGTEPAPSASPLALLEDVGAFLKHHSMRGSPDMFLLLLETLVDLTGSAAAYGKQEKAGKRGGIAARNQGASVAEAAFALLPVAMNPRHGSVTQIAAVVCQRLTAAFVGLDAVKRSSHGWDRRSAALQLINSFLSSHDATRPCRTAFMRRLCLRAPDRAECRQMALSSVLALVPGCTPAEVRAFCLFLYRVSRTQKISNRMIAADMASALLSNLPSPFAATGTYQRLVDGTCGAGDQLEAPWSAICLAIVVSRSSDKSASVRSKAIGCLADCMQALTKRLLEGGHEAADIAAFLPALSASRHIQVQVTPPRGAAADGADGGSDDDDEHDGAAPGKQDPDVANAPPAEARVTATIPGKVSLDLAWMRAMCHARCRDDKAAVRKAALLLLESVLQLCAAAARSRPSGSGSRPPSDGPSREDVQLLEEATADSLVSVRKSALQVVCNLVACYPNHADLACVWARSCLPLIRDPESSVQEAVLDRFSSLLLEPLMVLGSRARGGSGRGGGGSGGAPAVQQQAAAEVRQRLAALALVGRAGSSCVGKALGILSTKKLLKAAQVAAGLEAFLVAEREEERRGGSARGAEEKLAASRRGRHDPEQERERQQRRAARDQCEGAWMLMVEVAGQDPAAPSWQFLQRCWGELQARGAGAEASAQEGALLLWVISHAASRFPAAEASDLGSELLQAVLGFNLPSAAVAAHLAALHKLTQSEGGQAIVGPPAQWCARVQGACEEVLAKAMEARSNLTSALATHCQLALFTLGEVVLIRETAPPGGAAVKVQALTYERSAGGSTGGGGGSSQQGGSAAARVAQTAVVAHAWTCLGKMCMVDEGLAKKCVPLLVQEMSGSPSPVVRTNLLVGLADMVVQFTGLADAYVGRLADMVRDPHELVRRQALALLANLLLRDYVKWRGSLVHRFLLALVDESPGVRHLAQYLLSDSLASKAPLLAYNHFIESLFVLNACSAGLHASRAAGGGSSELASELALHSSQEGGGAFHLKGSTPIMRAKRDIIYTALLRRMSPEQRFSAFARLTAEVLGGVVDGLLPLAEADEVLGDALRLLACKDMKVNANRFGASAEEDVEQLGGTQDDVTKARGKLVGAMMRKHLAESVVPLMVELRYMLQAQKHPLLGSLMLCMATLLRDYKSEVGDILVADRQLALEIAHDLKHYESLVKQQQQQQEAAMAAALASKPATTGLGITAASDIAAAAPFGSAPISAASSLGAAQPRPGPANQQRKTVLPGVEPGRTPVAAEVLATAAKNGQTGSQATAQRTPFAAHGARAAAGRHPPAMTPTTSLPCAGPGAAVRTPHPGVPLGSAQRAIPNGMRVLLSPAPLSTKARAVQRQQRTPGTVAAAAPLAAAYAAHGRAPGAAAAAATAAGTGERDRVTVVLPSPIPSAHLKPAPRPLGPHNAAVGDGATAADRQPPCPAKPQQRTPQSTLTAAVRAARQAAAAALGDERGSDGIAASAGAGDLMDVDGADGGEAGRTVSGRTGSIHGRGGGSGKGGPVALGVKQKAEVASVGAEEEGAEPRGGRARSIKRRHGAA